VIGELLEKKTENKHIACNARDKQCVIDVVLHQVMGCNCWRFAGIASREASAFLAESFLFL